MQDMAELFGKINEFQTKLSELKQELAQTEVTAEAGGGMVKVTANGNREIIRIELDKDIINPDDKEMIEDLVVAGVNKVMVEADKINREKMGELTRNILPGGLPGMDLSNLGL